MKEKILAVHLSENDFEKVKKLLEAANLQIKFVVEESSKNERGFKSRSR